MRRLIENVIPSFQTYSHVNPASEFGLLLLSIDHNMLLEIVPPAVHRFMVKSSVQILQRDRTSPQDFIFVWSNSIFHAEDQRFLKWLCCDKHQILIPHGINSPALRYSSPQRLVSHYSLHINLGISLLISWYQILSFNYINPEVPKLRRKINLGTDVGKSISTTNSCSIRVPSFRESFISLSTKPNSQHKLSLDFITFPILEPIPLRSQGTIRRNSLRYLIQIKDNPTNQIIFDKILVLDSSFKERSLNPIFRKGENLVPLRIRFLLEMPSGAFVVSKLNLNIRVTTTSHILAR
uniref:Uncharacterized protein n=1 Tax=Arabidopsis thaliana TaxID=3702 RepID=Q0WL62_ARATH|nr:hypothetical protein [Arabidopsis thaliana]